MSNDKARVKEILKILSKSEKRSEKDVDKLLPILRHMPFFKEIKPMNEEELSEIC